jgi:hypothetical protein
MKFSFACASPDVVVNMVATTAPTSLPYKLFIVDAPLSVITGVYPRCCATGTGNRPHSFAAAK